MHKKIVFSFLAFVSALLIVFADNTVYAETIPDKPPLTGVYDPHDYLSDDVIKEVAVLNQSYSKTELKPQIAVVIVDEVDGNIESVANETATKWQVGFSDTNYGLLVLISVKEHKIRTETSNNMGLIIPDSEAKLLNDSVKDDFRNGDYSSGMLKYLSKAEAIINSSLLEGKQNVEKKEGVSQNLESVPQNLGELIRNSQKEQKSYVKKYGLIGAIIAGVSILIFIFIGIKIEKLQKEEEEYYKWKKKYPSSSSGSGSISYRSASRSYDSFSSSSSSSSYDSSSSSSSSSSWSGGGFDGGGSSGSW